MDVVIYCGGIQVNAVRNNSSLNQGNNVANAWSYYAKANISVGQVTGNRNIIPTAASIIYDPDIIDNAMTNAGGNSPVQGSFVDASGERPDS